MGKLNGVFRNISIIGMRIDETKRFLYSKKKKQSKLDEFRCRNIVTCLTCLLKAR
jgi:hypothetical protein